MLSEKWEAMSSFHLSNACLFKEDNATRERLRDYTNNIDTK